MDNQQEESSPTFSTLIALGAGIAIGALAGLLLAPRSGRESRTKVMDYLKACGANVHQKLRQKKDIAKGGTSKLATTLGKVVQESQEALKEIQGKVHSGSPKNGKKS